MVALLVKACVSVLKKFPDFNSSLDGDELVLKRYYHLGFAADTPQGLLVPVIRDVDEKGLLEIAGDLAELSGKAREGKISAEEMRGAHLHDLLARRDRRHRLHADRQRSRGRDPRRHPRGDAADLERLGVRAAADAARSRSPTTTASIDGAAAARFSAYLATELADFRRVLL